MAQGLQIPAGKLPAGHRAASRCLTTKTYISLPFPFRGKERERDIDHRQQGRFDHGELQTAWRWHQRKNHQG